MRALVCPDHPDLRMIFGAQKLRFEPVTAYLERRPGIVASFLCLCWLLPGLFGRDPWKPDEANVFGVVFQMIQSGDWLVPSLAGEPDLRNPPLYYALAALFAQGLSPLLPLHEGARLVNLLFVGGAFWLLARVSRDAFGPGHGWIAPLLLLGCVGMVQPSHQLVPDNVLPAAFALALWGQFRALQKPLSGGIAFGLAVVLAFLSRGAVATTILVAWSLLLPALSPMFRTGRYGKMLVMALLCALPGVIVWPLLLMGRDPALLEQWLAVGDIARHLGLGRPVETRDSPFYYFSALPWFAWPVLPFAAWSLWQGRHKLAEPAYLLPGTLFLAGFLILSTAHDARELFALPLLVPLVLITVPGIATLPRSAAHLFFWFSIAFFLFFITVVWVYFSAAELGVPVRLAERLARREPGFAPRWTWSLILIATLFTLGWFVGLFQARRSNSRPFLAWAAGAVTFWVVAMTLLVGFLDHAKSYRGMIASMQQALPTYTGCVASVGLGDAPRALIHYFAGITTQRLERGFAPTQCDLVIVEGTIDGGKLDAPWEMLWEGSRPGDKRERYRLYFRNIPAPSS